ncbi:conserved protein, unknown function [Hepatocystis sp. ex Piliocolobus tephrosceles]|nr:conserved protein, unknown function [Hepatocystis sp. ex Piliocolobus tephrosceles]
MEDDFNFDEAYIKSLSKKYKNVEHPLFMDKLPNNIEENEDLTALYNLMITDENEYTLAKNYKEVGNDYYKEGLKHFDDAIISYTKGIDILNKYLSENESKYNAKKQITAKTSDKESLNYEGFNYDANNKNNSVPIPNTNSTVANTNSTVANTNSVVANTNSTVANTNSTVANTNSTVANTNSTVANTNSTVANTNSTVANRNNNSNNILDENITRDNHHQHKKFSEQKTNHHDNNKCSHLNVLQNEKEKNIFTLTDIKNLLSDLYCNRAIIFFKKKMYVKCLNDCKKSFFFNKTKYKSIYYLILCSNYLELYKDAYQYITMLDDILKNKENANLLIDTKHYERIKKNILEKYTNFQNNKKKKEQQQKLLEEKKKQNMDAIQNILKKRSIQLLDNAYNNNNIEPVFYLDLNMYIHFTVFFIFFQNNIIDTILDFSENQCIMDYYDVIKKNQKSNMLLCYMEFINDQYYFINNSSYICDILNKIKLFSQILSIHVIEDEFANEQFKNGKNINFVIV